MWDFLTDWSELVKRGGDAVTYFLMAAVGTTLFVIRLIVGLFGGDSGDFDADAVSGTDGSFNLFSLLSVLAFIMGTGWMGLAARIDWGLSRPVAVLAAVSFGTAMMFLAAFLMSLTRRLNREVSYDMKTAVGRTARAYMKVPAKGAGLGKVQVSVSGRLMTVDAASVGPAIPEFADVKVVDVRDDHTLIVAPLGDV
jgi:hypothetical protein